MARTIDGMSQRLGVLQFRLKLGKSTGSEDACRETVLTGLKDFKLVGEAPAWKRQLTRQVMVETNVEEMGRMQG
jgi:hypothetical protein